MTKVGRATLALVAVAVVAVAVVGGGSASSQQAKTRHDRLGVRRCREHGAVRRPGARDREVAHREINKAGEYEGQAAHLQHAGQQARDREGVRARSCSARAPTSS